MHVHLPKPLHGWREFAGEVGIIVVGVLIALAAEGLVERWHWQGQVSQANAAFKDELLQFAYFAYERQALQPCLNGRLQVLASQLNESDPQWRAMPERFYGANRYYVAIMPVVYRPPTRPIFEDAWNNALADGTINHLDRKQATTLSSAYESVEAFKDYQDKEGATEALLSPLGADRAIDEQTRIEMLQTVAQLDRINGLMVTETRDFLTSMKSLDLGITSKDAEAIRKDVLQTQRDYRGKCVAAPPLDLVAN